MKHVQKVFDNKDKDHRIAIFSDGTAAGFIPSILELFGVDTMEKFVGTCNEVPDTFFSDEKYSEQYALDNGYEAVYDVSPQ